MLTLIYRGWLVRCLQIVSIHGNPMRWAFKSAEQMVRDLKLVTIKISNTRQWLSYIIRIIGNSKFHLIIAMRDGGETYQLRRAE